MNIEISGASGLIATALIPKLEEEGHIIYKLVRKKTQSDNEVFWSPSTAEIDLQKLEGIDAVIHLAGENISSGRWSDNKKSRIMNSRVHGTTVLSEAVSRLKKKPAIFISASAMGYYGNRGDEILTENSSSGDNFVADVCEAWEASIDPKLFDKMRVVMLRIGLVLTDKGGALKQLALPMSLGLGGIVGPGTQYMSWITLEDIIRAIIHILKTDKIKGPVNLVGPDAVTNRVFIKTMASVMKRPALFQLPSFIIRLVFGQMGEELLLSSMRVVASKLKKNGFKYKHNDLAQALEFYLKR
jgi:uncharacterized protein (TIGR01777 family)